MPKAMSTQAMLNLAEGTDPYLAGVRNLVDTCKYHVQVLQAGAGALPAATQFFNVAAFYFHAFSSPQKIIIRSPVGVS